MKSRFLLGNSPVEIEKDLWAEVRPGGDDVAILRYPVEEVHVGKDGNFWIVMHSRELIKGFMEKSAHWTEDIQRHWNEYKRRAKPDPETWRSGWPYAEDWVKTHPYKTWGKPDIYPSGRPGWDIGDHGTGNTVNFGEDYWIGDVFAYTHFVTPEEEGAVIGWHLGGDVRVNYDEPEVWLGDFEGFMAAQSDEEWFTPEGFLRWNEIFKGSLIWAIDQLGGFDGREPLWDLVYRAIAMDPTIVKGPIANKILQNERAFPPEVVRAVKGLYDHA